MVNEELNKKNQRMFFSVIGIVFAMVALSFITPQLYNLFCRVTGYGGTTQRVDVNEAENAADERPVLAQKITIRFDANISKKLPWRFAPTKRSIEVNIGEETVATYYAKNLSTEETTGTATFNVTPLKAGKYFSKMDCFCFSEQTLEAGEQADMPLSFFVDPSIVDDPVLEDVDTITLSYSFFPVESEDLDKDMEKTDESP